MTTDKEKLEQQALEAISKHNIVFINELCSYLAVARSTFYELGLDKSDTIKENLEANRISLKAGLRAKWYNGNNPTAQIALYKLLADESEKNSLNDKSFDTDSSGKESTQSIYLAYMQNLTPQ